MPHLRAGTILRTHRANATALGRAAAGYMDRGSWPDELVISMLMDADDDPARGFLLDGFPRAVVRG